MRPKSLLLLMLALGCGLVASIGINQVLASRRSGDEAVETVKVYVLKTSIGAGDEVKAEMLDVKEVPKDLAPVDAILADTKVEDVATRRARSKLYAGDYVAEGKLLAFGESSESASGSIPIGMRTVPVTVDEGKIGRLIQVGDHVDVLVHLNANLQAGIKSDVTFAFLQDIKVFAVDDKYQLERDAEDNKPTSAKTVSLLVELDQAQWIMLAEEMGELRLVMRSANDKTTPLAKAITAQMMLQKISGKDPSEDTSLDVASILGAKHLPVVQPVAMPVVAAVEPFDDWTTIVYEGATPREVRFRDGKPVDLSATGPAAKGNPAAAIFGTATPPPKEKEPQPQPQPDQPDEPADANQPVNEG